MGKAMALFVSIVLFILIGVIVTGCHDTICMDAGNQITHCTTTNLLDGSHQSFSVIGENAYVEQGIQFIGLEQLRSYAYDLLLFMLGQEQGQAPRYGVACFYGTLWLMMLSVAFWVATDRIYPK